MNRRSISHRISRATGFVVLSTTAIINALPVFVYQGLNGLHDYKIEVTKTIKECIDQIDDIWEQEGESE